MKYPRYFLIAFLSLSVTGIYSQKGSLSCTSLKTGTFYSYPKNSVERYKLVRTPETQIEYDLTTNDTTVYKVKWINDCSYSLEYQSSTAKRPAAELEILTKRKLVYDIVNVTAQCYIINTYLDKNASNNSEDRQLNTDTVWQNAQSPVRNRELFKPLTETESYLRKKFKDTSSYAILYLYRQGKFMAMLNEYYVYCDNSVMFWAKNKARQAFKIFRQGPLTLYSRSGKEESKVIIDVEFGKRYYVQCIIHHKVTHATPELKLVDKEKGQVDFESGQ